MNDIYRRRYMLEFDVWDPQRLKTDAEFDSLMFDLKNKVLLSHAGNVKITPLEETRIPKQS